MEACCYANRENAVTVTETIDAYVASWAEADEGRRRGLLEKAWAPEGTYTDPTADVAGRETLVQHIGGFHQAMPGARIELTSGVSEHHGRIYFAWRLITGDGATYVEGVDFGRVDAEGRLAEIVGFFGPPGA